MAEQRNRVLARKGARGLSQADIAQVGGFGTPVMFTETTTFNPPGGGIDHMFDEKQA
ncbi:MAG TPA: hypothetical protein VI685_22875 [Candidatus Angelobacter sp.]